MLRSCSMTCRRCSPTWVSCTAGSVSTTPSTTSPTTRCTRQESRPAAGHARALLRARQGGAGCTPGRPDLRPERDGRGPGHQWAGAVSLNPEGQVGPQRLEPAPRLVLLARPADGAGEPAYP